MTPKFGEGDKPCLYPKTFAPCSRLAPLPILNAARLLEMFTKADEILSEGLLERTGDVAMPMLAQVPSGLLS